jgi:hypothetical protein
LKWDEETWISRRKDEEFQEVDRKNIRRTKVKDVSAVVHCEVFYKNL